LGVTTPDGVVSSAAGVFVVDTAPKVARTPVAWTKGQSGAGHEFARNQDRPQLGSTISVELENSELKTSLKVSTRRTMAKRMAERRGFVERDDRTKAAAAPGGGAAEGFDECGT
jgi:hypothetical protein